MATTQPDTPAEEAVEAPAAKGSSEQFAAPKDVQDMSSQFNAIGDNRNAQASNVVREQPAPIQGQHSPDGHQPFEDTPSSKDPSQRGARTNTAGKPAPFAS